jgi:hypothetical protein
MSDATARWAVFSPLMNLWAATGPDYAPRGHPAVITFAAEDHAWQFIREAHECLPPDAEPLRYDPIGHN